MITSNPSSSEKLRLRFPEPVALVSLATDAPSEYSVNSTPLSRPQRAVSREDAQVWLKLKDLHQIRAS